MVKPIVIAGMVGACAVAYLAYKVSKQGPGKVGEAIGAGVVNTVGGVASGAVGAIGSSVGLPTPSQTTTDPAVARWLIDNAGHGEASKWSGAWAYTQALFMAEGSGTPPPPGTDLERAFPSSNAPSAPGLGAYYNEPSSIFSGAGSFSDLSGMPVSGFGGLWSSPWGLT